MNWVNILRDITKKPRVHWNAYQIYCRYHKPITFMTHGDPECKRCKGSGWGLFQIGEDDVCKDICTCIDEFSVY